MKIIDKTLVATITAGFFAALVSIQSVYANTLVDQAYLDIGLCLAAQNDNAKLIVELAKQGARVASPVAYHCPANAGTKRYDLTSFGLAVWNGSMNAARELIDLGASANTANLRANSPSLTNFELAAQICHMDLLNAFVEKECKQGGSIYLRNSFGFLAEPCASYIEDIVKNKGGDACRK